MNRPRALYPILIFGMLCTSSSSILIRFVANEVDGITVATIRTSLAVLLLLPFTPRVLPTWRTLSVREWRLIALAGIMLGLHFVTWISSLYYTSVASSTVLVNTSPITLAIAGYFFLGERLSLREWMGVLLGFAGAALLAWGDTQDGNFPQAVWGNTLALLGMATVSVYLLAGRVVRQHEGLTWLGYVFPLYAIAALTVLGCAWVQGLHLPHSPFVWLICLLMALGPQIAGHGAVNYAVRYLPPAFVALMILGEPILASFITFIIWGEQPSQTSLFGMGIVLIALVIALYPRKKSD